MRGLAVALVALVMLWVGLECGYRIGRNSSGGGDRVYCEAD